MAHHQNHTAKIVFRNVSRWGDWPTHAIIGGVLLLIAWLRGNKNWTRIFLTMLIACLLAGVSARVIKITTGRARPSVRTESVWNGPRFSSKYHAFPSGHTAASAAFFGTLLFVSLRLGLALHDNPIADRIFAHVCRRALPFRCSLRRDSRNHVRISRGEVVIAKGWEMMAEGVGFEPTRACALPVFKTGAINHSTTPPLCERNFAIAVAMSKVDRGRCDSVTPSAAREPPN